MNDQIANRPSVRIVSVPAARRGAGGENTPRFWGMTARQRLERAVARAEIQAAAAPPGPGLLLIRDDFVLDEMLLPALLRQPGSVLVTSVGAVPVAVHLVGPPATERVAAVEAALRAGRIDDGAMGGLRRLDPVGLATTYNHGLRKREAPYLLQSGAEPTGATERRMFNGAYKGVTDFVTKRVWPWPAFHVTRLCARLGIAPNLVTAVSLILVVLAFWLFWRGDFALGLAAAWGMCFLDTVDGKLARVTLNSSSFGNVFDHGIDLIHPPFWYYAWYRGLIATNPPELGGGAEGAILAALILILLGYVGGRLQEGAFQVLYGIQIHTWRPIDSWFREITARRNPNLFILTLAVILGNPRDGFLAVAAWTAISFAFHMVRILQAALATAIGRAPVSWLTEPMFPEPMHPLSRPS